MFAFQNRGVYGESGFSNNQSLMQLYENALIKNYPEGDYKDILESLDNDISRSSEEKYLDLIGLVLKRNTIKEQIKQIGSLLGRRQGAIGEGYPSIYKQENDIYATDRNVSEIDKQTLEKLILEADNDTEVFDQFSKIINFDKYDRFNIEAINYYATGMGKIGRTFINEVFLNIGQYTYLINILDNYKFIVKDNIILNPDIQYNQDERDRYKEEYQEAYRNEDYETAIKYYILQSRYWKDSIFKNMQLASLYCKNNKVEEAIDLCKRTMHLSIDKGIINRIKVNLGAYYLLNKNYQECIEIYNQLLDSELLSSTVKHYIYNNILVAELLSGKTESERINSKDSIEQKYNSSIYYLNKSNYEQALNCLKEIKHLDMSNKYINKLLSICYAGLGQKDNEIYYMRLYELYSTWIPSQSKSNELTWDRFLLNK